MTTTQDHLGLEKKCVVKTKVDRLLWILTCVGGVLMFAGGGIESCGRRKAGIRLSARPYCYKGEYYWCWRGDPQIGDEDKRIAKQQYDTFLYYQTISWPFWTIGGLLGLGAGIPAMICLMIHKSRHPG